MAYSLPLVAPSNFILKLKIQCSKCENKLKKMLLTVQGVHSVSIDAKQGTVTISGTVEPSTIMMLLEKVGRKAELLWEQSPPPPPSSSSSSSTVDDQNVHIIAESKMVDERFYGPNVEAQLQQLSGIKGLKNVEVYSKTIKLTLKGEKDDLSDKNVQVTIQDGVYSPQIQQGSGICGASASCCGGHHHVVRQNVHGIGGCCGNHAAGAGYPIGSNVCSCWPQACGCVPPPAAQTPWPGYNSPSAPTLGTSHDAPPPPPVMGYSYTSPFSDDNPSGGCNIF